MTKLYAAGLGGDGAAGGMPDLSGFAGAGAGAGAGASGSDKKKDAGPKIEVVD